MVSGFIAVYYQKVRITSKHNSGSSPLFIFTQTPQDTMCDNRRYTMSGEAATAVAEAVLSSQLDRTRKALQDEELHDDHEDLTSCDEDDILTDSTSDSEDEPIQEEFDLGRAIMKEIREETYVCLVCTCEISPEERFWPCSDCHRVYHMSCISSWSQKGSSTDEDGNWKCPACHSTHRSQKFQFKCWCKKVLHPQVNPLNPGSCGQTCGAKLEGCPHKCSLPCHPGPHAACNALGPIMKCHCGKHTNQWPCVLTPYEEGWDCDEVCPEMYPCELHECGKICHDGLCGQCPEFVESLCYCGMTKDMVKCHLREPKKSYGKAKKDNWIGNFKCSVVSAIIYDCGVHSTDRECQPSQQKAPHCPLSPDLVKTCHCGQTEIEGTRTSCTDPIPTCDKVCSKILPCGHKCQSTCHEGECSPCYEFLKVKCQCGFNSFVVPCKFIQQGNTPTCTRKCSSLLSCRRHRCNNICCEDESAAIARERLRKKGLRNNTVNTQGQNDAFLVEASHVCLQVCNRKLTCGNPDHTCQRTCHAGPCPPCLESTNDDLVCHCGNTVVMAPIRCGTRLPPCDHQCVRELPCGHPQMPHNCHEDDVPCPKCTHTTEKLCNCGKNMVRALCFQDEVFCAERCSKPLPCQHRCLSSCHKGDCKCTSICGKKKKYCNHVDKAKCHFPSRCNDSKPCMEEVEQTCQCGRVKKKVWCNASATHTSAAEIVLNCDVSCVVKEREEKLREAFGMTIDGPPITLDDLAYPVHAVRIASVQQKWCAGIETTLKEFMASDKASMLFKPMRREQRQFVHEMAEAYGLYSEGQDPEPYRGVFVKKKQNSKVPTSSLNDAILHYEKYLADQKKNKSKPAELLNASSMDQNTQQMATFNAMIIDDCLAGVTKLDLEDLVVPVFKDRGVNVTLKWLSGVKYMVVPEAYMRMSKATEAAFIDAWKTLKEQSRSMYLANTVRVVSIDQNFVVTKVMDDAEKIENTEDHLNALVEEAARRTEQLTIS